jgi:hypothetical protein
MRVLTHFERFPKNWELSSGETGRCTIIGTFGAFVRNLHRSDVVIVDGDLFALKVSAFF